MSTSSLVRQVPTRSPLYSMGARSFSPSPMTTVPLMFTRDNIPRIPSTAASSTSSVSPMPMHLAASSDAVSVTRTSSSIISRSLSSTALMQLPLPPDVRLVRMYALVKLWITRGSKPAGSSANYTIRPERAAKAPTRSVRFAPSCPLTWGASVLETAICFYKLFLQSGVQECGDLWRNKLKLTVGAWTVRLRTV